MDIGQNIRARRKALKMTLEQLAFEIGSDTGNLSRIERGQQSLTTEKISVIAQALKCSPIDLMSSHLIRQPENIEDLSIGQRIRQMRKTFGWTQRKLAEKLQDASHGAVSQWESSTTRPNAENLYELSQILQCSFKWLLKGENETTTLADRIKNRLDDLGKSQADLAKYCKVKPPSVSKWLNGTTKVLAVQNLLRASEFLECDPDWLASGKGFWATQSSNIKPAETIVSPFTVKMLDADILNKYLINTSDISASISYIEYTEDQYCRIFAAKNSDSLRLTNIRVDNMSGTLELGDLVFVDISINKYDGDGVYLFMVGSHLHLKRLQMVGNNLLVISDNRQYKSWEISTKDRSNLVVIGRVLVGQSQIFQRF